MKIESLTPSSVRKLVSLTKLRERLLEKIETIEATLADLFGGKIPSLGRRRGKKGRPPKGAGAVLKKRGRKKGSKVVKTARKKKGNRGQRPGALKGRILGVLEKAGAEGISVTDIASKLDVPKGNVHVWFSTTGKRLKEVDKMRPGWFCLRNRNSNGVKKSSASFSLN